MEKSVQDDLKLVYFTLILRRRKRVLYFSGYQEKSFTELLVQLNLFLRLPLLLDFQDSQKDVKIIPYNMFVLMKIRY